MRLEFAILATGVLLAQTPSPDGSPQPFGLKGDVLGETLQEFRTRNDRVYVPNKRDPLYKFSLVRGPQHFPKCTGDGSIETAPLALKRRTEEENRAQVIQCVLAEAGDPQTVAGVLAYEIVYSFFQGRLYMITAKLNWTGYEQVREALISKYGKPEIGSAAYQNAYGAVMHGEELTWNNSVSATNLGQFDGGQDPLVPNRNDPLLLILHSELNKQFKAAGAAKGAAKDL